MRICRALYELSAHPSRAEMNYRRTAKKEGELENGSRIGRWWMSDIGSMQRFPTWGFRWPAEKRRSTPEASQTKTKSQFFDSLLSAMSEIMIQVFGSWEFEESLVITRLDDVTNLTREKLVYYPSAMLKETQRTKIVPTCYEEFSRRTKSDIIEELCIIGSDWSAT